MFLENIAKRGFFDNVKNRLQGLYDYIERLDRNGTLDRWAQRLNDGLEWGVNTAVNTISHLIGHFEFLSKWFKANPAMFDNIKNALIALGAVVFPKTFALFVLEDILSWLEGKQSVIGDFAKQLSTLTGIDAGSLGTILASLSAAGAAFLLTGGTFGVVAKGLSAIATSLGLLGGAQAAAGIGALSSLRNLVGGLAAGAATMALLDYIDPKGNLGGATTKLDNWIREKLGLASKETGVTPVEIYQGAFGNAGTEYGDRRKMFESQTQPRQAYKDPVDMWGQRRQAFENDTAARIQDKAQGNAIKNLSAVENMQKGLADLSDALSVIGQDVSTWKLPDHIFTKPQPPGESGQRYRNIYLDKLFGTGGSSAPKSSDAGAVSDKVTMALANMNGHLAKMTGDAAAKAVTVTATDARQDNRQFPQTISTTIHQTVQQAVQAPAAAAQAVGSAVSSAASKNAARVEGSPSF